MWTNQINTIKYNIIHNEFSIDLFDGKFILRDNTGIIYPDNIPFDEYESLPDSVVEW